VKTLRIASSWKSLLVAVALVVIVASCSGSAPSPTEPIGDAPNGSNTGGTNNSGNGGSGGTGNGGDGGNDGGSTAATLSIDMIDDPTEDICELWVYIKDIRVKPDEESPVLLGNEIGAWDLLSLQNGNVAPLGTWEVEAGVYQFIEILLDESLSYVIEVNPDFADDPTLLPCLETQTPLQIPSEKFKVNGGPFSVDSLTTVTIDFDAEKSLKRKGSPNNPKGWQLNPKVSIVDVEVE
jgi:hypothetical protein